MQAELSMPLTLNKDVFLRRLHDILYGGEVIVYKLNGNWYNIGDKNEWAVRIDPSEKNTRVLITSKVNNSDIFNSVVSYIRCIRNKFNS